MQRERRRKKYIEQKKHRVLPIIIITLILFAGLVGGLGAKYISNSVYVDNQAKADAFYFTIDLLGDTNDEEELTKTIHLYGGEQQVVNFKVQNFFDSLRISGDPITYSIEKSITDKNGSTSAYANVTLEKNEQNIVSEYKLTDTSVGESHEYVLTMPAGYEDGTTVTVTVKSSTPYVKEMTLIFILHPFKADVTWRIEDEAGSVTASLIVMSDVEIGIGKLKIDWTAINGTDNVLQIDMTDTEVLDVLYIASGEYLTTNDPGLNHLSIATNTKAINAGGSIEILFFKTDPNKDYATTTDQSAADTSGVYTVKIEE